MEELNLSALVLAAGTAAFGIMDGLKGTHLGLIGFREIDRALGPLMSAVRQAYGSSCAALLESFYRHRREDGELAKILRQGVRSGLGSANAADLAGALGTVDAQELETAAAKLALGSALGDADRSVLGHFELAADARIDAAIARAEARYITGMRIAASLCAVLLALLGALALPGELIPKLQRALIVGVTAVPLAPIAKDVARGIRAARAALGGRP